MDVLNDVLHRDYGIKPQGKAAPMGAAKATGFGPKSSSTNDIFSSGQGRTTSFNDFDAFAGPPKPAALSSSSSGYDDIFRDLSAGSKSASTLPVYDAPVYDDDIFGGVNGVRSSSAVSYDDVFSSARSPSPAPASFEDLLGEIVSNKSQPSKSQPAPANSAFGDLIPGFGTLESHKKARNTYDSKVPQGRDSPNKPDDPFVVLDGDSYSSNASSTTFHDPLEDFGVPLQSAGTNDTKTSSNGAAINDIFDGFPAVSSAPPAVNTTRVEKISPEASQPPSPKSSGIRETVQGKLANDFVTNSVKNHVTTYSGRSLGDFELPGEMEENSRKSFSHKETQPFHSDIPSVRDEAPQGTPSAGRFDRSVDSINDRWITIDEVVLFTQPTSAPPPRRPPPPLYVQQGQSAKTKIEPDGDRAFSNSAFDKHEDYVAGRSNGELKDDYPTAAAEAAAMMEAMEKAEARLKEAKEAREREREARILKTKETERKEREERMAQEAREREEKERALKLAQEAREREEKERSAKLAQEAREREEREKEEQERERRRLEMERERELERERERERDRLAVERATREARERAAAEARERAQRAAVERATREARERAAAEARQRAAAEAREKAEREAAEARRAERAAAEARQRAAVERATAEARERAERAAVEKAAAEARERAAAEARERAAAERAAVERAAAEVRMRAERAAVEKANAEARERAAAAAAAARERQRRSDNDLESFFSNMGSRANSAPKQRPTTADSSFDELFQSTVFSSSGGLQKTQSTAPPQGMRKAASSAAVVDDLTSLFNTTSSSDVFQEVDGESEDRRRARWERYQRTRERAAKALAEKNERDLQAQREQAERHRLAETVDAEIKRWAAGKEGNLRALLSTLQYILWPEAGWQPVSLTDIITAQSVKKVYRKATLCVHPDKVQQKGATIQQKYTAEKVFDLLKEAWNKFNSEELF
eukprot:TRINITY_DN5034_c0_g2_i2.p1 TRINITY_DN5034_c0_g2~~TRINITY_DN5034_c0_g2_i2.p1  ORF type:complete len:954 (+),score=304.05 TRINITY_DN5034_c0_g2_i2:454-3315(+)